MALKNKPFVKIDTVERKKSKWAQNAFPRGPIAQNLEIFFKEPNPYNQTNSNEPLRLTVPCVNQFLSSRSEVQSSMR